MSREQSSSLARYFLVAYALLVVYASLYPFTGWRDQGVPILAFLTARFARPFHGFDFTANVIGYVPLGFLAVLALYPSLRGRAALVPVTFAAIFLSFVLESLQLYLPARTSSNLDLIANGAGGAIGALLGRAMSRPLLDQRGLQTLRDRVFLSGRPVDLGLVLLGLWLLAQLNPGTLLFATGDLRDLLRPQSGKLYTAGQFVRFEAIIAGANALCVGLLASCLVPNMPLRRLVVFAIIGAGLVLHSFAFGLLSTPQDILTWLTPGALYGVAAALASLLVLVRLPRNVRLALAGLSLLTAIALVNLAPANPYLAATLALWQEGQYFNFNRATRIVSDVWPFAAMVYLVLLAADRGEAGS